MVLSSLIKRIHRNMPEATLPEATSHLNWAYKKLICQDVDEFLFRGGKGNITGGDPTAWKNDDPFSPYPILYWVSLADSNPLLDDEWNTFHKASDNTAPAEGFNTLQIDFDLTWEDIANTTYLYNCYKIPIVMEINSVPIVVRKVKNIFTFEIDSINRSVMGQTYRPFNYSGRAPITEFGDFVSIPFKQIDRTPSSPCKIFLHGSYFNVKTPFFVEFYYEPPDIINENSACLINLETYSDLIFEGALGRYEEEVNSLSQRKERFEGLLVDAFRRDKNAPDTNTPLKYQRVW